MPINGTLYKVFIPRSKCLKDKEDEIKKTVSKFEEDIKKLTSR